MFYIQIAVILMPALFSAQIGHFEKELDDLKTRCRNADFRVGSKDDMRDLWKDSENLHAFTLEIRDTTEVLPAPRADMRFLESSSYYLLFLIIQ